MTKLFLIIVLLSLPLFANEYVVVMSKDSPINSIEKEDLKRLYLGKHIHINGLFFKVLNQDIYKNPGSTFIKDITNMEPRTYLKWWIKQQIIGRGVAPHVKLNDKELIEELINDKLNIGYILRKSLTKELKVINIIN